MAPAADEAATGEACAATSAHYCSEAAVMASTTSCYYVPHDQDHNFMKCDTISSAVHVVAYRGLGLAGRAL